MVKWLFFLFSIVPVLELYVLIKIGGFLGALNTVILLVAAAFLGALLVRLEGARTFRRMMDSLSQGTVPAGELVDGLLIFAAGVLLITPGVFTDLLALVFLVPVTRAWVKRWLRRKLERMIASGRARLYFHGGS
ncbi:MAG TPA: FxsA family protein [candidate division Zixibacteria bacterium]|nr:FxsA family protein [candidate division Zixibacteria bacterium]